MALTPPESPLCWVTSRTRSPPSQTSRSCARSPSIYCCPVRAGISLPPGRAAAILLRADFHGARCAPHRARADREAVFAAGGQRRGEMAVAVVAGGKPAGTGDRELPRPGGDPVPLAVRVVDL